MPKLNAQTFDHGLVRRTAPTEVSFKRISERAAVPLTANAAQIFVRTAYLTLLGREPDPPGLKNYVDLILSDENKIANVLDSLSRSDEYRRKYGSAQIPLAVEYDYSADPLINTHRNANIDANSQAIKLAARKDLEKMREIVAKSIPANEWGMGRYYDEHEIRFLEIINSFKCLFPPQAWGQSDILDVGGSILTKIIHLMIEPHALDLLDRFVAPSLKSTVRNYFNVDLSDPTNLSINNIPNRYNFIIFTEVIEHLLANPKRIITFLGGLLKDGGYLYITTPNFFSKSKLAAMRRRVNPQPIYPEKYTKADAPHFHVREYCMSELLQICVDAGLNIHAFIFSDCWESQIPDTHKQRPEELGNLLVIARRG